MTWIYTSAWLVGWLLSTGTLETTANQTPAEKAAFVEWATERAVRLETLDWRKADVEALSVLDKELEGKRIIYLGEPDHGIREKHGYRLLLLRYLYEKGWRHVGVEGGLSDGKRADLYLETGDESFLDRRAAYGYRGDLRTDRDDIPQGIPGMREPELWSRIRSEGKWFFRELRAIAELPGSDQERFHWFAYDLDTLPGGGYADTETLLSAHAHDPLIREVLLKLERVDNETRKQEIRRLRSVVAFIRSREKGLAEVLGEAKTRDLIKIIQCLADGVRFVEAIQRGPNSSDWQMGMQRREEIMGRHLDEWLDELPRDEKVVLLGHNLHLCKRSTDIWVEGFRMDRKTIGTHLAERFPGEVYCVWMLYDHGRHLDPYSRTYVRKVSSRRGTIESDLARVGSILLLPLHSGDRRESFLQKKRRFVAHGQSVVSTVFSDQADAIFFLAEVSELRER